MIWKIEIKDKPGIFDATGAGVKKDISDLGIKGVKDVSFEQVYILETDLAQSQIKRICEELLVDPVTQEYSIQNADFSPTAKDIFIIEVAYNPGVMDPWEESVKKGIKDLGIKEEVNVRTAKEYQIKGKLTKKQIDLICDKILVNKVIQHAVKKETHAYVAQDYKFELITVDLLNADDAKLIEISKTGQLYLNLAEMKAIKDYFAKIGRNPTDCELESIAQTWSEHCKHKTLRGKILYEERLAVSGELVPSEVEGRLANNSRKPVLIDNLLKSTVMRATEELNKPWCVSVFKDNSGIIKFDDEYNVCFKVETHNHPSALEPYGGANTGLGGVIRDPLGTGLGAKPILNTDIFCFGPPDYPFNKVPQGSLHPKRIMKGVVAGVRDYGNRMGIPTVNGAVLFDERYVGNPLVYCGNVGIMPKDKSFKKVSPGDLIVAVGGRTGRDGIHGATFSSAELTTESETISAGAVQIGNPITEKKMVDTLIKARDLGLYSAVTDCGAGGFSSAVGELGEDCGARVDLEKIPLKYHGLTYAEMWISEAQERMVLAVPKENLEKVLSIFSRENVEATCIGEFTNDGKLKLYYEGNPVCDLDMDFLHKGVPVIERKAVWEEPKFKEPKVKESKNLTPALKKILSSWNVCSKEWVIRQYDHEVQGGSVIKPLVGIKNDGPGDAAVAMPRLGSNKGIVLSCGINPKYGEIDPYWMAASAIDEALRQVISVGGNLKEVAILDNFCWGNTDKPKVLGALVRAAQACYDIAKIYQTPFISGKDSLNNEYKVGKESIAIPPTLLISAIGIIEDVRKCITMDAKDAGNLVYVVGNTFNELGGSHYYELFDAVGNNVPKVAAKKGKVLMEKLSEAVNRGFVRACHDCSEGGIAVTAAEMAFAGGLGMKLELKNVPLGEEIKRDDFILFSESNTRFIVEVPKKYKAKFETALKGIPFGLIGKVEKGKTFSVKGVSGKEIIRANIDELKEAWQKPLRW